MSEYIYSVYTNFQGHPLIARARVVKRIKMLTIEMEEGPGAAAFRWSTRVGLDSYASTPEEAVARYRRTLQATIDHATKTITHTEKMMALEPKPVWKIATDDQPLSEASPAVPSEAQ